MPSGTLVIAGKIAKVIDVRPNILGWVHLVPHSTPVLFPPQYVNG